MIFLPSGSNGSDRVGLGFCFVQSFRVGSWLSFILSGWVGFGLKIKSIGLAQSRISTRCTSLQAISLIIKSANIETFSVFSSRKIF